MIYTTVNMTIGDYVSVCDKTIVLYRGDKNVEIRFVIHGNKFIVVDDTYAQLIIKRPSAPSIFSEPALVQNDTVILTITEEMIDELKELGAYTFQIVLYDEHMTARATLPPCHSVLIIEKPIAIDGESVVNLAEVNDSIVMLADTTTPEEDIFTEDNKYNRTIWKDGDLITDARLNKIEEALYYINENGGNGSGGGATAPYISTELPENVMVGVGANFDLYLDFNSPNMGKGTLRVFVNDVDSLTTKVDQGETVTVIPGDLFIKGTNQVVIYVLDRVGVMSNSLTFYVRYGSTEIVSTFDAYSAYDYGSTIRYYFTPTALDTSKSLTFYMTIDGLVQEPVTCTSDVRSYFTFPTTIDVGRHYCEAWVTDGEVKSNVLKFNLIILDDTGLVVASDTINPVIEEGEQLVLDYKVYMKNNSNFIVKTYVDETLVNTGVCGLDFNYYKTSSLTEGIHTIKIEVFDETETHSDYIIWTVTVTESTYTMLTPVSAGSTFIASAKNRSNADENREVWVGINQDKQSVEAQLIGFSYDSENGWVDDKLIISGKSWVEIPVQPLASNAKYGFTLDVEFMTKPIGADNAEVLNLWNDEKNCGIKITTEELIMRSADGNQCDLYFAEEENVSAIFVIDRDEKMAKIYLNGVMCEAFALSDYSIDGVSYLEDFTVNSNLYLGGQGTYGYCEIKNIRVYEVALSSSEILNNFMANKQIKSEQKALVDFQKGDTLPTLTVYCDFSGLGKDDKKPCNIVYNSPDENLYGKSFTLGGKTSQLQYQGTSSMAYPIKNYRLNLRDENGEKWKYNPYSSGQPEARFTLKADFMSSGHWQNTGLAKWINDNLYHYDTKNQKSMNPSKWYDVQNGIPMSAHRETINGFPCRLILVNDGETPLNEGQQEPTPGNTKDMGIFNFNNDKDNVATLGFDSDIWPNCASYEVTANSDTSAGAFMSYVSVQDLIQVDYYIQASDNQRISCCIPISVFKGQSIINTNTIHKELTFYDENFMRLKTLVSSTTYTIPTGAMYFTIHWFAADFVLNNITFRPGNSVDGVSLATLTYPNYNEADELAYLKESFELRHPDEDDVAEDWGFMGVEEEVNCVNVSSHDEHYIYTSRISKELLKGSLTVETEYEGGVYLSLQDANNGYAGGYVLANGETYNIPDNISSILIRNKSDQTHIIINGIDYIYKKDDTQGAFFIGHKKVEGTGLKALIDWVDNCTDEEFVRDFEEHFHKDYTLRYYLLVIVLGMVDNLGKNMMLDTWDNKIFMPRFYDMDTICSYDNSGQIKFDVDIEMEQGYWNTSASRLWTRIRDLMHDDLVEIYKDMRANGMSYESFMNYFYGEQIAKIPQKYYNMDADVKYLPYADEYIGKAHGDGYEHLKRWLKKRLIFTDTLFDYAPSYNNDVLTIRANTTEEMTIEIETYTPVYQHLSWYNGQMDKKKIDGKISVTFSGKAQAATDQEVLIYGGSNIKCIRGISSMNPNQLLIGAATRLTELDVSGCTLLSDVNSNKANFSPHSYLTKLNISGCTLLGGNLRINNSNVIQEINASNTAITGVIFPKTTKNLTSMLFSNCTGLTSLDLSGVDTSNFTNMWGMFADCKNLTSLDVSGFDTSNVTRMDSMFSHCNNLTSLDVSGFDTSNVANMWGMFNNCNSLTSLDVSGFDTSKVTSMAYMFNGCMNLTSLDVSGFDTSKVTNMSNMFSGCSGLTSLDVSGFDTSKVTAMEFMFTGCIGLASLDLSGFDTSNVTSMRNMFNNCTSLTSLDVSGFDTSMVTNMSYMFSGCKSLTSLDVSGFDTSNVTAMYNMFDNCKNLTSLDVSGFDTSKVGNMAVMFFSCTSLTSLDVSGFDTSKVTNMYAMFQNCKNLTSLDVSGFDTSNVTNMNDMFRECRNLTSLDVSGFETSNVTNMNGMFNNCASLTSLDVSGFDTSNVTNMEDIFSGCSGLTSLDLSGFDTSNVASMRNMFYNCNSLTSLDVSGFDTSKVSNMRDMFDNCNNLKILNANNCSIDTLTKISEQLPTKTETSYGYLGASEVTDELTTSLLSKYWKLMNGLIVASYQATSETYTPIFNSEITQHLVNLIADGLYSHIIALPENFTSCLFDGGSVVVAIDYLKVTSNVTDMGNMFAVCSKLTSIDLSGFETSKVTNMNGMFSGCKSLTSLDLSGVDTSNVTNMSDMFYSCNSLTSLDVSVFDTSNVTNMNAMFHSCGQLTSLDVSGFDTSKVKNMGNMFYNCKSLTSLDLSGFDTSNVTYINNMFYNCNSLTSLDLSGFDTSNVIAMSNMFDNCKSLASLDLSEFDTSKVNDMESMFRDCNNLTSLDLSGFDTSNVGNMYAMFQNCKNLTSLDLSGFDTSNVGNMYAMFQNCKNLTSLDLSGFDTSNVTEMADMFYNCNNLKILNANNCSIGTLTKISEQLPTKTETSYGYLGVSEVTDELTTSLLSKYWKLMNGLIVASYQATNDYFTPTFDSGYTFSKDVYEISDGLYNVTLASLKDFTSCSFKDGSAVVAIDYLKVTSNVTGTYNMFYDCKNLTSLDVSGFDTSNVTNMYNMFFSCTSLTSLDVSGFDTSNVTTMNYMFNGCSGLTSLDLSGFVTSNVTEMSYMFNGCSGLTSLDLSGFDTSNVTNMNGMFNVCTSLTSLDVSGFDTSKVTNMAAMFFSCTSLTSLDLSGFDTSKVTTINSMFHGCASLTSLDVSGFDTSKVTTINSMFHGCDSLTSLDLSGFDTSEVTLMHNMFQNCKNLTSLDLSGFDTSNVTNMNGMFYNCTRLTSLDLSGFETSKVTSMESMFRECKNLTSLDVSGFDTSNVTTMSYMFNNCASLTSLDVSGFDTSNVTDMNNIFSGCSGLTSLDVSGFDASKVTGMSYMFQNCKNLTSLDVSGFDTSKVTSMTYMFSGCSGLTSLDVSGFDTSMVTNMSNMFVNCWNLTSLDVSGFDTSNVTNMHNMFHSCTSLTSLDLSGFDTSEVTLMHNMFVNCTNLTSLDLSGFDTSKVINMSNMFQNCTNLTSLDVSGFDTSNVTNMNGMFQNCNNLTSLDLSGFDTSNVTSMSYMFNGCSGLTSLDLSGFVTSKVTSMNDMFHGCKSLTSLDLSGFDTSNVTNMYNMFSACTRLTSLDSPKNISTSLNVSMTSLDITSLLDIIENLAAISIVCTLNLGATLMNKLSDEQILVAVNKGWSIV